MSTTVEQIKDRLSIVDVVGGYVKLAKAGKNYKAPCPFHREKTPSFFVSPDRGTYHCFGCGAGGDMFSFVQEFEHLDFRGALQVLADRAGVRIERADPKKRSERDRLLEALEAATLWYERKLSSNAAAAAYLRSRGVSPDSSKRFRIGWANDAWRDLSDALRAQGFTDGELVRAGLLKEGEKNTRYDTFRSRIMFPIMDNAGRVVGFSGRYLGDGTDVAKYLNTPETDLFKKGNILYGMHEARHVMRKSDFAILVEGQLDLVLSHQAGFRNAVAVSGTALTEAHLAQVRRITGNLVLALDPDDAGKASARKASELALPMSFDLKLARLPEGMDPADTIRADPERFREAVRTATHAVEYFLAEIETAHRDPRKRKTAAKESVLPIVARIENKIDREHFIGVVADRIGTNADAVRAEVEKIDVSSPAKEDDLARDARVRSRRELLERKLAGLILWQEDAGSLDTGAIIERFVALTGRNVMRELASESSDLIFEAEAMFSEVDDLTAYAEEMLSLIEEETLRDEFSMRMQELKMTEARREAARALEILAECKRLSERIEALRRKHEQMSAALSKQTRVVG